MTAISLPSFVRTARGAARRSLIRLGVLVAFLAAAVAFASRMDGDARFLAATGIVALLGVALLDRPRGAVTAVGGTLLLFVLVAVPSQPLRGTGFLVAVAMVTAVAASRRWHREEDLGFPGILGLAFVLQAGFRPEWLLPGVWSPETLARLLLPPVLVAGAVRLLRWRLSSRLVLVLFFLVVVVCRGATLTAAFALVAPMGIELLRDRGWRARTAAGMGLAGAALVWRSALVGVGALAALFRELSGLATVLGAGILAAGALLAAPPSDPSELWLPILLCPALLWPGLRSPFRLAAGLLLAWAGWRLAGPGGLALGGSWLAISVFEEEEMPGPALPWIVAVSLGIWVFRAYPWLGEPERFVRALGFPGVWWATSILVLLFVLGVALGRRRKTAWLGVVVALWAGLLLAVEPTGQTLRPGELPLVLGDEARVWWTDETGRRVEAVTLESALAHAVGLEAGTEVGRVVLVREGAENVRWTVVVGESTGEWAARSRPGVPAPEPWVVWVADDSFFGQRYRASWRPDQPVDDVAEVRLVRSRDLPEDVDWIVWTVRVVSR